jgi:formylglycine-generating enzyme required for sulfatase activity
VATAIEVAPVVPVPGPGPVTPGPPPPSGPLTIGRDWTVPDLGMEFVWLRDLKCWVGRYEVTNAEFRRFRSEHSSQDYKGQTLDADRQPAVRVRLDDARAFAQWLTSREQQAGRLLSRYEYRLPVWKEWVEFAVCHSHRLYPWGNEWPPRYGNFGDETAAKLLSVDGIAGYSDGFAVSCPVDESGRSDWGLYGVAGNAWEWTADGATGSPQGGSWRFRLVLSR